MMIEIFNNHFYKKYNQDGSHVYLPSVTTILGVLAKKGLDKWYQQVGLNAEQILNESAERGSRVHDAIDKAIKGYRILYNPAKRPNFDFVGNTDVVMTKDIEYIQVVRAIDFLNKIPYTSIQSETNFASTELGYGGTVDVILNTKRTEIDLSTRTKAVIKGQGIIDWKTGNPYPDHKLQVSAYSKLVGSVDWALIVYTNTKSKLGYSVTHLSKEELEDGYEQFKAVKKVYDLNPMSEPKEFDIPLHIALKKPSEVADQLELFKD